MKEFQNRNVVVTGGASGIGKGIVEAFAKEGANVVFADVNHKLGLLTQAEVSEKSRNQNVYFIEVDMRNTEDISGFIERANQRMPYVDVLVNNVGVNVKSGDILSHDLKDFEDAFHINVFSAIACIQGFLPSMQRRKKGAIVNIASTMGYGTSGFLSYSMTKEAFLP